MWESLFQRERASSIILAVRAAQGAPIPPEIQSAYSFISIFADTD
jgi:hypothetical protein